MMVFFAWQLLSYCTSLCTRGLFFIIVWETKQCGDYLTLLTPLLCVWWSLFEIWLSDGVYLNVATEFDIINFASDLELFRSCSLKGEYRTNLELINNLVFAWHGSNLPPCDSESNTKPLSYRTNDENSQSISLLTLKCDLSVQMTKQSYSSLFKLTVGFIPISIKNCDFDCKSISLVKNCHRQLVLSRDRFSNYLKQHDERLFFCKLLYWNSCGKHDKRIKI